MSKHTLEFKREALKLSEELGVQEAARQLGVSVYTLKDWRKRFKNADLQPKTARSLEEAEEIIRQLKRQHAEDSRKIEVLKETLGFFVQSRKK